MKTDNRSIPFDTTRDSAVKQFDILRKMDIEGRAAMTFELSDNLRSILASGIRQRHPDYNDDQIKMAVMRLTIDKKLFDEAFPDCKVVP